FCYHPAVTFWGSQISLLTDYRGVCTWGAIGAAANYCGHVPNGSYRGGVCKCFHPAKCCFSGRHPLPACEPPQDRRSCGWRRRLVIRARLFFSVRAANGGSGERPSEFAIATS